MFYECYDKNGNYIGRATTEEGAKNLTLQANRLIDQKEEAERRQREILLQQEAERERKQQEKAERRRNRRDFTKIYYKHFLATLAIIIALVMLILPYALYSDIYGPNTTYFDTIKRTFYWITPEFVIPNHATEIRSDAFEWCDRLTKVTIPNGVTSIRHRAFRCCGGLTSVTIPDSVTSIGVEAFENCNLTSVIIGKGVREIDKDAFHNCPLKNVYCKPLIPPAIFGKDYWYGTYYGYVFSNPTKNNNLKIYVSREAYSEYKNTNGMVDDKRYKSLSQENWDIYYRNIEPYDF